MSVIPIRTAPQQSTVVISGKLPDGKVIVQELPIPHTAGVTDFQLIDAAIKAIRAAGGMMTDGENGTVNFYPLLTLTDGINFGVKRVSLVIGSLPPH